MQRWLDCDNIRPSKTIDLTHRLPYRSLRKIGMFCMHRFLIAIFLTAFTLNANALSILYAGTHPGMDPVPRLEGLGHTVTNLSTNEWGSGFDYSPYDVVAFGYDAQDPRSISNLVAAVRAGQVGVVFLRGWSAEATAQALGLTESQDPGEEGQLQFQSARDNLNVLDNSHPITEGIELGLYDLGYKWMTHVTEPGAETTALATGEEGVALLVHNSLRVAATPFYGWLEDYDLETEFGIALTERTLQWAAQRAVLIDIRPSSSVNRVFPETTRIINVAVLSTSVADGEEEDFDATQVDPDSLRFGIGEAANVVIPRVSDVDGDSDNDVIFGFNTQETGIVCGDTEASLTGKTYSGSVFAGVDSVVTVECTPVTRVDIDIRPSNPINKVFPTSTKPINVAVLTTNVVDGDAVDFDATQIKASTLRFAIGRALNVGTPRVRDVDGDLDNDVTYTFNTQDTDIACGDTQATLVGRTNAGDLFTGSDAVVTVDCDDMSCHP